MFFIFFPIDLEAEVVIISDNITYSRDQTTLKASGNVVVQFEDYKLTTPELTYDKRAKTLIAKKPIELQNKDKFKFLATTAEISDDFKNIIASHASALIEKKFYVRSKKIHKIESGKLIFYSSVGTACQVCPSSPIPMWQIKSEKILHDHNSQRLYFSNASMELLGFPVFYTPYLRIPEPGIKRATGLLTPKILTSDLLGVGVKQPFYFVIDRSSDLTASLLKTTNTKFLLETDYRKIFATGSLSFSGAAKPHSESNILDGYFQIFGKTKAFKNSLLSYDVTAVSDSGFLGKYGYSDTDRLTSTVTLTRQMPNNFSQLATTYFTSLRDNEEEEFVIVPNFFSRHFKHDKRLNLFSGTEISLIGLTKKNFSTDFRVNASFDAEKIWQANNGVQTKGTTRVSSSFYQNNSSEKKKNLYKYFDPTIGLELSLPLYKTLANRLDVIKPTLQLVYNPDVRINEQTPDNDSQQVKLDQSSLFSLNRFSGLDRQETGLRLNSGVKYSVENNGLFSYDLALGQIFRKNPSTQFSEGSGLSGMKSDILISGNLDYDSLISIHGEQLYDQNLKLKHAETTINYLRPNRKISTGLIFFEADLDENRPNDLTELTLGVNSKLTKNWISSFDLRRNLNSHENINASLKFSYENECAKINLSFKKRFTETNSLPEDTSIELTFDLNGIGEKQNMKRKFNCLIYD